MIRTKAYLLREIVRLKKQRAKLIEELKRLKVYNKVSPELKKTVPLVSKEIDIITVKVETLYWCANTSEKQLPKIKGKKKKEKKVHTTEETKKK